MYDYSRSYQIDYLYGWRYVLSAEYRKKVKQKWDRTPVLKSMHLLGGLITMVISTSVIGLFMLTVWALLNG